MLICSILYSDKKVKRVLGLLLGNEKRRSLILFGLPFIATLLFSWYLTQSTSIRFSDHNTPIEIGKFKPERINGADVQGLVASIEPIFKIPIHYLSVNLVARNNLFFSDKGRQVSTKLAFNVDGHYIGDIFSGSKRVLATGLLTSSLFSSLEASVAFNVPYTEVPDLLADNERNYYEIFLAPTWMSLVIIYLSMTAVWYGFIIVFLSWANFVWLSPDFLKETS